MPRASRYRCKTAMIAWPSEAEVEVWLGVAAVVVVVWLFWSVRRK